MMRTVDKEVDVRGAALLCAVVLATAAGVFAGGRTEGESNSTKDRAGPAPFAERVREMSWDEVVAEAAGQEVFFYMWGGSESINEFVQGYVGERLEQRYEIRLNMVPVSDAGEIVNKVLGERQAGRSQDGSVDIMWINGENFRTMREADLLFGPYAAKLPNLELVDISEPVIRFDFGYPVEGYESPYGGAQFVMVYDRDRFDSPPETIDELLAWARDNPGRFTYPAPPDFNGSAFVRHVFYHVAGGSEEFQQPFDQELFDEVAPPTWDLLNELEPHLWRSGETYPETRTRLQRLFVDGQVDFDMDYNPRYAANLIQDGRYPQSARTFVFEEGTIANTHYLAIPFNASAKAAAMVVANFMLEPETQLEKTKTEVWGDPTVLSMEKLPEGERRRFEELPRSEAVLEPQVLQEHRLPEPRADWIEAIEEGWRENVLQQ